jgi:membrane associated rhomboid family serine protease
MFPFKDNIPNERFPTVTVVLIALTTIACLLSIGHHGGFPVDLLPLLVSMLFLAIFGPTVEDTLGRVPFLALYLLGGLAVLGSQMLIDPGSTASMLGAAGAVTAVLAAYIVLYPRARVISLVFVIFFFTIVEVPALLLLGLWLAVQTYFALAGFAFA